MTKFSAKSPLKLPVLALILLSALIASLPLSLSQAHEKPPLATVHISRNDMKVTSIHVEMADSLDSRIRGLMFRESLPPRHGMYFNFSRFEPVRMWMKNTLIPLDMLFIDRNHQIVYIQHNAQPHSLTPLGPKIPVASVIEINGGEAKTEDIRVGDYILLENKIPSEAKEHHESE